MNASNRAEGGTSAFSWVADLSSRLVVMATTSRYFFRHLAHVPFDEGTMRRTGSGWDRSFFLAVRKRHPRHTWLPEEGGAAGNPSIFDALVPLVSGGTPCRLFYFLRAFEPDRYALPKLSDPLLLTGARLEEGEWVE